MVSSNQLKGVDNLATNKNITMKQFNGVDYDTLYPKTIASQIDDVYSKDEMSNLFLPKAGGSMGGILDMNGNQITNLPTPTSNSEPATKEYVDGIGSEIKNKFNISNEIPVYVVASGQIIGTGTVHNYISYSVIDIKNTTQGESTARLYKSEQIQDKFLLRTAISPSGNIGLSLVSDKQNSYAQINKNGYINVSEAVGERSIYVPFLCF